MASLIPMKKTSFASGIISGDDLALELVTGENAAGKSSYALVLLPANKVKDLKIALSLRDTVLENYGKVLARGEGLAPPKGLIEDIMGLLVK